MGRWSATVEAFKCRTEAIQEKILGLETVVKKATDSLADELNILVRWDGISGTLDSKIKKKQFQAQFLIATNRIRKNLVRHVNELQIVAEEFLAQPVTLFSDNDFRLPVV